MKPRRLRDLEHRGNQYSHPRVREAQGWLWFPRGSKWCSRRWLHRIRYLYYTWLVRPSTDQTIKSMTLQQRLRLVTPTLASNALATTFSYYPENEYVFRSSSTYTSSPQLDSWSLDPEFNTMDTNDIMERRIDIIGGGATVQRARVGHAAAALLTPIPVQLWRFCCGQLARCQVDSYNKQAVERSLCLTNILVDDQRLGTRLVQWQPRAQVPERSLDTEMSSPA